MYTVMLSTTNERDALPSLACVAELRAARLLTLRARHTRVRLPLKYHHDIRDVARHTMPLLVAAGAVLALAIYALYTLLARPARIVPGPESAHWFYGNMRAAWARGPSDLQAALLAEYGPVVSYFGIGNVRRLARLLAGWPS
jgi:hypothetical protein